MQTWEYSPLYAIRSWLYISLHAAVIGLFSSLQMVPKQWEFYLLRAVLGVVCAACETRLFSVLSRTLNPRIAVIFVIVSATTPGMFHASTAYLPSSFAMYTSMLGIAAFMDGESGQHTVQGIVWFAAGGIIGWPFAVVLSLPFLLAVIVFSLQKGQGLASVYQLIDGAARSLAILVCLPCISPSMDEGC